MADQALTATIAAIHYGSRSTYGAPRVHAELRLGLGVPCGRKRVARLMRAAGLVGVCDRRKRRGQRPLPDPHEDLVQARHRRGPLEACLHALTSRAAGAVTAVRGRRSGAGAGPRLPRGAR